MEVWSGSINTASLSLRIKLVNSSSKRDGITLGKSTLSISSFVNPSLVPLYARAGPSFEVHTADGQSVEWLKTRLLGNLWLDDLDEERGPVETQCPTALLLNVEEQQTSNDVYPRASNNNISELLVYGILSTGNQERRLPSPPDSHLDDETSPRYKRDLRIYAAPLSTSYVQKAQDLPSPPSSPAEGGDDDVLKDGFTQFLPDLRSPTPKRKRMLSIFEEAAQHHRRVRQYGGSAVSQLITRSVNKPQQQQIPPQTIKIKGEPEESNKPVVDRLRRARSLSVGGSQLARLGENARISGEETRPSSSRGTQVTRRSLGKRDASQSFHEFDRSRSIAPTPDPDQTILDHSQLSSPPKTSEAVIATNKDLITRTILTGMRLYGYNRKTSRPARSSIANLNHETDGIGEESNITGIGNSTEDQRQLSATGGIPDATVDEDDFKAMYHATYKAATFALRRYLKINGDTSTSEMTKQSSNPAVLAKDKATNVIDEILGLFCDAHLTSPM
ncbi:hypothetical protein BGW36DRAFT_466444 [Talaromyces proteolyticus]|uniref:Sld7 C-terminal domain-containing protein n=1 Tax=Talaromyces proteolyticus TaxID=1131652 RepID=A0AAD4KDZ5_9EURO|nr:uncharacterized protein BGW36DRAFT_466444 [Talaromyces proteolyticus]KAH8689587.1 hypothetical protein BGW36DRAFT_466444 [Talaromyces proteolyticus]